MTLFIVAGVLAAFLPLILDIADKFSDFLYHLILKGEQ